MIDKNRMHKMSMHEFYSNICNLFLNPTEIKLIFHLNSKQLMKIKQTANDVICCHYLFDQFVRSLKMTECH